MDGERALETPYAAFFVQDYENDPECGISDIICKEGFVTARSVGFGDSVAALLAAYPAPSDVDENEFEGYEEYSLLPLWNMAATFTRWNKRRQQVYFRSMRINWPPVLTAGREKS